MPSSTSPSQCKEVALLHHWDNGVMGVFHTVNEAKNEVRYMRCENYTSFYKNKWGGWSYRGGGYEINKMPEDEAEILFRFNDGESN